MADEELIELKERAAAQFLDVPGVTAVGLGGRERDGRPTGEVVLKVFVERKRPAAELTPGQLLPPEFEGIGVDVVELPEPTLEVDPAPPQPGSPGTTVSDLDPIEYRPLKGGARVQISLGDAGLGTLGCFLTDPADPAKVYALTNFHVVEAEGGKNPVAGTTRLGQPDNQDGPTKSAPSHRDLRRGREGHGPGRRRHQAGRRHEVARRDHRDRDRDGNAHPHRRRGRAARLSGPQARHAHRADGRDRRGAQHEEHRRRGHPEQRHRRQAQPNAGVKAGGTLFFSDRGDSGSAVVNDSNEVVALHFAGSTSRCCTGPGLPIADILTQFRTVDGLTLAVATATDKEQVKTVPGPRRSGHRPSSRRGSRWRSRSRPW